MIGNVDVEGAVERNTVANSSGIDKASCAFALVAEIVDGMVALGGGGGVEMIVDSGVIQPVEGYGCADLCLEDIAGIALGLVAKLGDGNLHLGCICSVKVVCTSGRQIVRTEEGRCGVGITA